MDIEYSMDTLCNESYMGTLCSESYIGMRR